MNQIINNIYLQAKSNLKKIVLPESLDSRVQQAAKIAQKEKIAQIILLDEDFYTKNKRLNEYLSQNLYVLRQNKGITIDQAKELIKNPLYYGTMMVKLGLADGMVAGAQCTTQETFRPALPIIKSKPDQKLISSFFIMEFPNQSFGYQGLFIFADCGLNINPTADELSQIAIQSAKSFKQLIKGVPKISMLSYSTNKSSSGDSVEKVIQATELVKQQDPTLIIEGEIQADAALVPAISLRKNPQSLIKGETNILIFPNLDAGNISYKLLERLGSAKAYGPLTQGINLPINDLSRGCSIDDIVTTIAITSVQSQTNANW